MTFRSRRLAAALAAGITLASCSGGTDGETDAAPEPSAAAPTEPDDEETSETSESPDLDEPEETGQPEEEPEEPDEPASDVDLEAYFEVVGGAAGADKEAGRAAAADGTPAAWYLEYLVGYNDAQRGSGMTVIPSEIDEIDGGYKACADGVCSEFSDLETDEAGRLTGLSVDGSPIAGRIAEPGATADLPGGGVVELTGAYFTEQFGGTLITTTITNGDEPVDLLLYVSEYVGADGVEVEATDAGGPDSLRAGSTAHAYFAFKDAPLGGTLYIIGQDPETFDEFEVELEIPSP